ncbi:hypothetical protein QFZ58_000916 [Streptomyces sp. B1I3]|nr:hypothetical protein [Streptomyces sp. B1I3]
MSSVVGMSHPQSYEILLYPEHEESGTGAPVPGTAIRSGVVAATGDTGASGYPRYAGDGMEVDIDPSTHTVEALLVDGAELDYGLTVRIAERMGAAERENGDAAGEQRPEEEPPAGAPEDRGAGAQGAGARTAEGERAGDRPPSAGETGNG